MSRPAGKRYDGSVGVVTGAGPRIGAATACRLAAEGARVVGFDIDGEAAEKLCSATATAP